MKKNPKVSVLLPVYNCEKYLAETLSSLICQTYENFEVIAIDDGSTDDSFAILKRYAAFDTRIRIFQQPNAGLVKTLNKAASLADGDLYARIDGDDLSTPKRIELQVHEMVAHPDCVLLGSSFDVIDEASEFIYHDAVPTLQEDIMLAMYYRNPLAHGSIMMRRAAFEMVGGYSPDCGPTEDYELWSRLIQVGSVRVLPNSLFRWRVNPQGITSTKSDTMKKYMDANIEQYWQDHPFHTISRRELVEKCRYYLSDKRRGSVSRKHAILHDLCKVSLKLMKRGRTMEGLYQLLVVCSTGRTGFRVMREVMREPINWHINRRVRNQLQIGKKKIS